LFISATTCLVKVAMLLITRTDLPAITAIVNQGAIGPMEWDANSPALVGGQGEFYLPPSVMGRDAQLINATLWEDALLEWKASERKDA